MPVGIHCSLQKGQEYGNSLNGLVDQIRNENERVDCREGWTTEKMSQNVDECASVIILSSDGYLQQSSSLAWFRSARPI